MNILRLIKEYVIKVHFNKKNKKDNKSSSIVDTLVKDKMTWKSFLMMFEIVNYHSFVMKFTLNKTHVVSIKVFNQEKTNDGFTTKQAKESIKYLWKMSRETLGIDADELLQILKKTRDRDNRLNGTDTTLNTYKSKYTNIYTMDIYLQGLAIIGVEYLKLNFDVKYREFSEQSYNFEQEWILNG
jgi:hypothetical protein